MQATATVARRVVIAGVVAFSIAGGFAPRAARGEQGPKIRAVVPTFAIRGGSSDVTIEGSNLYPAEEVTCSSPEVGAVVLNGGSDHKIMVRLMIPESAVPGTVSLRVRTKEGQAVFDRFTIRARTPQVTKVKPDTFRRGGEYDVTVAGTLLAFPGVDTKVSTDAPMTVTRLEKSTDKALALHLVVPPTTPPGAHVIAIETTDGRAGATIQVTLSPPAIKEIKPASVARGASADLVISGDALESTSAVAFAAPDAGARVSLAGAPTRASVTMHVEVAADALPGPRTVVLTAADGYAIATFQIEVVRPKSLALGAAGVLRGGRVELDPKSDLGEGATLRLLPADPDVRLEKQPMGTKWTVSTSPDARMGPRTIVGVGKQGALAATFHVGVRTPAVAGTTPAEVAPGSEADVVVEGQDLAQTTAKVLEPADGFEVAPSAAKPGALHVKVAATAKPGPRNLLISSPDGSAVAHVMVSGPASGAPAVSASMPRRVLRGRTSAVTVTGINLRSSGDRAPEVALVDAAGAHLPIKLSKSSAAEAVVDVSPPWDARPGGYALLLTTSDGTIAAPLQVDPALPSVASVTPAASARPAELDVAIVGENLLGSAPPSVDLVSLDGATTISAKVVSSAPDRVAAKLAIAPTAAVGTWFLVVKTNEGGSAAPFYVEPRPPSVSEVSPQSVGTPIMTELTLTGAGLVEPDGKPPHVQVSRVGSPATVVSTVVHAEPETLVLRITVPPGTLPGAHSVLVRTVDGVAAGLFDVINAPPPRVASIEPSFVPRGQSVHVIVRGTGLSGTSAVTFAGKGVTAIVLPGGTDEVVALRITAAADAEAGPHPFTLIAPGGAAAESTQVFTVR